VHRPAITLLPLLGSGLLGAVPAVPPAQQIVERSVEKINADWSAAPRYDFRERDILTKKGKRSSKTYAVLMIEGSPYNKLIASDGRPLTPAKTAAEEKKLKQEMERRRAETPGARQKRVAQYQRERRQDNALFREMARAFNFKLTGEETVNGHRCFVVAATPRAGYIPPTRETKVLTGMRGTMWIDEQQYQWVKVHAEVFRPVAFGLFIAHVEPGTSFTLEQQPVQGDLWLPSHFQMSVNAQILVLSRQYTDDESYTDYSLAGRAEAEARSR